LLTASLFEDGLLLPVLEHAGLGRYNVQLFLDLGEKGLAGTRFLFVAQRQINPYTRQSVRETITPFASRLARRFVRELRLDLAERHLQFGLVEEVALVRLLFAAATEAPLARQAQLLCEQCEQLLLFNNDLIFLFDDLE
jgi:hypothetical protein